MAERNIKILVRDKKALVEGGPVIVCGNSDYSITFDFDSDWNPAGIRTARFVFVKDGQVQHQDVVFEGVTVGVPVLSGITFVKVGVFEGDLCTTTPARITCEGSILCGSGAPEEPTPEVYDQIMALFDSLADRGMFGATEEQARQIEENRRQIEGITEGKLLAGDAGKLAGKEATYYTAVSIGSEAPTDCGVLWFNTNLSGVETLNLDLGEADDDGVQANINGRQYAVQNSTDEPTIENGQYSYEIL